MHRVIEYFAKSLQVIENGTIRKLGHGFLFAFHSNDGRIFSCFDTIHVIDDCKSLFAVADLFYDNMLFRLLLEMLLQTFKPRVVQIQLSRVYCCYIVPRC